MQITYISHYDQFVNEAKIFSFIYTNIIAYALLHLNNTCFKIIPQNCCIYASMNSYITMLENVYTNRCENTEKQTLEISKALLFTYCL